MDKEYGGEFSVERSQKGVEDEYKENPGSGRIESGSVRKKIWEIHVFYFQL